MERLPLVLFCMVTSLNVLLLVDAGLGNLNILDTVLSSFYSKKVKAFARMTDFDGDGKVELSDFHTIGNCVAKANNMDEGKSQRLHNQEIQAALGDIGLDKAVLGIPIIADDLSGLFGLLKLNLNFKSSVSSFFTHIFDALSGYSDSEFLTYDQFSVFYTCTKLSLDEASQAFNLLDTNKDKKISRDEFVAGGVDFFDSNDPSGIGKLLAGRIEL